MLYWNPKCLDHQKEKLERAVHSVARLGELFSEQPEDVRHPKLVIMSDDNNERFFFPEHHPDATVCIPPEELPPPDAQERRRSIPSPFPMYNQQNGRLSALSGESDRCVPPPAPGRHQKGRDLRGGPRSG